MGDRGTRYCIFSTRHSVGLIWTICILLIGQFSTGYCVNELFRMSIFSLLSIGRSSIEICRHITFLLRFRAVEIHDMFQQDYYPNQDIPIRNAVFL